MADSGTPSVSLNFHNPMTSHRNALREHSAFSNFKFLKNVFFGGENDVASFESGTRGHT